MQFITAGHFLAVGLGAAVGAWLRWMLAIWLNQPGSAMPWGTVVANLVGGYLIGLAFGFFSTLLFMEKETPYTRDELLEWPVGKFQYNLCYIAWKNYIDKKYGDIIKKKGEKK